MDNPVAKIWGAREYRFATGALREGRFMRLFSQIAGLGCFGLAGLILIVQFHPAGPNGAAARIVQVAIALSAVAAGARWLRGPWPTHPQALAFAVWLDIAIATVALTMTTPITALCIAAFLSVNGVYVAFLFGWRTLLAHLGFCGAVLAAIVTYAVLTDRAVLWDTMLVLLPTVTWVIVVTVCGGLLVEHGRRALRKTARSAHYDPLTGLRNRRGMYAAISGSLARASAQVTVIAAVCDIDSFKQLNDSAGHAAGDAALAGMAQQLKLLALQDELTARIGGDELVLVAFAAQAADAIDGMVERLTPLTRACGAAVSLTASIGIAAHCTVDPHFTVDDVLRHADSAMYEAKRSGGATCVVYATGSTTAASGDRRRGPDRRA
jgi:diguanylate cyclase (GGDEF)-like protein